MSGARRIGYHLSSEQFAAGQLVANAVAAEQAGFDQVWVSDPFHPWQDDQGHASHAWVILSAIGQATRRVPMGTGESRAARHPTRGVVDRLGRRDDGRT